MKKITFLLLIILFVAGRASSQTWTSMATDTTGDGLNASLLDGTALAYRYDPATDSIFFKVNVVHGAWPPFGINIVMFVIDSAAGPATTWNTPQNGSFFYNRVITAWYATATSGIAGVSDAMGFSSGQYTNLHSNDIRTYVDTINGIYVIGIKRQDIFNGPSGFTANVIAAVGSNLLWNDDIPGTGSGQMNIVPTAIPALPSAGIPVKVYPNPSSGTLYIDADNADARYMVDVTDELGKTVYRGELSSSQHHIELNGLARGLYLVRTANGKDVRTDKVLVN